MREIEQLISDDLKSNTKIIKKGIIVQRGGEIARHAYYIKKGILRSYKIDANGKEHIFNFAAEGWIIADLESQEFNQPAELFIDCIEDAEILKFDRKKLLAEGHSEAQLRKHMKLMARRIGVLQKRVIMLMSASAKERYLYFLDTYPDLPNRVPQHMIASYLGITPQALSTIRKRLSTK